MEERDFFDEKPEQRTHHDCPHCGQPGEYRSDARPRKKARVRPRRRSDRARFAKAQATWSAPTT